MIIANEKYVVNDELRSEFQGYTNEIISLQKRIEGYDESLDKLKDMSGFKINQVYNAMKIYIVPEDENLVRPNGLLTIPSEDIVTIMEQITKFIKYQKKQAIHTLGNVYNPIQLKGEDDHPKPDPEFMEEHNGR